MKFYSDSSAAQKQTQSAISIFTCWDTVLEVLVIFSDYICHTFVRRKWILVYRWLVSISILSRCEWRSLSSSVLVDFFLIYVWYAHVSRVFSSEIIQKPAISPVEFFRVCGSMGILLKNPLHQTLETQSLPYVSFLFIV